MKLLKVKALRIRYRDMLTFPFKSQKVINRAYGLGLNHSLLLLPKFKI